MSTSQPDDIVGDPYPRAWRPSWAPEFPEPAAAEPQPKVEPLAMELHAAAMTDEEWSAFVKRARGGRN